MSDFFYVFKMVEEAEKLTERKMQQQQWNNEDLFRNFFFCVFFLLEKKRQRIKESIRRWKGSGFYPALFFDCRAAFLKNSLLLSSSSPSFSYSSVVAFFFYG